MALTPTNSSEAYLSNKDTTSRLSFILDALLRMSGLGSVGAASFHYVSTASANQDQQQVSANPCVVTNFDAGNTAAYWTYVKLYNKVNPTSADTPQRIFALPPGGGISKASLSLYFSTALGIRIVKGAADNDATAVLAGDVVIGGIDYNS